MLWSKRSRNKDPDVQPSAGCTLRAPAARPGFAFRRQVELYRENSELLLANHCLCWICNHVLIMRCLSDPYLFWLIAGGVREEHMRRIVFVVLSVFGLAVVLARYGNAWSLEGQSTSFSG